jgi:dienelactone hydrolase
MNPMLTTRRQFLKGASAAVAAAGVTAGPLLAALSQAPATLRGGVPRALLPMSEEVLGRASLNDYGSLEQAIQLMRAYRPLDLNAPSWRAGHPRGRFEDWARQAREVLATGLHYGLPPVDLQARTLERVETASFIRERIEFNTAPWFRVSGFFYTPKKVPLPAPALVVMHEWGGPMLFGAERVCGDPVHPVIVQHRDQYTSGRALSDWYAANGYAVITIDAFHFGRRAPRGIGGLPEQFEPADLDAETFRRYHDLAREQLYLGVRQLNWAGTTWAGVNYGDDSRCIDYLLSRREVDGSRIGCTGLSGGGWRTNIMAALERRLKAVVSVGWMTTGDMQQAYNLRGAIGTFCLLPGVWDRIDVPDLISMAAPTACMVVSMTDDRLFPPQGQIDAAEQIADVYQWTGMSDRYHSYMPPKQHVYDRDIQEQALAWFDRHLKGSS